MRNYWTCSKFADWIRGTTKIKCGTGKEWAEWEKAAKARYPIRWWIAEEGLDHIQDVWCYIPERINDVRYYINNRWLLVLIVLPLMPATYRVASGETWGTAFCLAYSMSWLILLR
jgi:hypothetical protein